jgi:DNA polymerase-3 subunit alpha
MSNQIIKFPCGCQFNLDKNRRVIFDPDIENINLECPRTWKLIGSGNTKGVFQLESRLGRSIAKKLKPEIIEHLSALLSIVRPGCLESIRDNKSVTQHYIDRKNGEESIDYFHPALEPSLKDSYGEMIYQEQAMDICVRIAGFTPQQADDLRKAIGKKKADEMAKVKTAFMEGCKKLGIVNESEAETIFAWIEKSQRYSFNHSHAVSYAMNSYLSAYAKAHFPKMFFKAYLKFARDKIDPHAEIKGLFQNATEMDITVRLPDLRMMNEYFFIHDGDIYFGLRDIKSLGDSVYKKLIKIQEKLPKPIGELNWLETLFLVLNDINSTAAKAIIECGAISYINKSRSSMLYEFQLISDLSGGELKFCNANLHYKTLGELLTALLESGKVQTKRVAAVQDKLKLFKNPPYSLSDTIDWLSDAEYNILGTSVSCSKVDAYDISMTNVTCKELKKANQNPITSFFANKNIVLGGEIENVNVTKTKKGKTAGQEMAFLEISDNTGVLDNVIVFPETYKQYRQALFLGNIVVIMGNRSQKGDSLIVDKVYVAKT